MRPLNIVTPDSIESAQRRGAASIAVGLALLTAAAWSPTVPVVTAMAVVALGASMFITMRPARPAFLSRPPVAFHLFVYSSLYLLFVGAVLHAAMAGPLGGLSWLQRLDLGASVVPMAVAVRLCLVRIAGGEDAPAR